MLKLKATFWIVACAVLLIGQLLAFQYFSYKSSDFMNGINVRKQVVFSYPFACNSVNTSKIVIVDHSLNRNQKMNSALTTEFVQSTINDYKNTRNTDDHLTIVFESGNFVMKPINMTSYMTLCVLPSAQLLASVDISDYSLLDPLPSYGQGREMPGPRYHNLIQFFDVHNSSITGGGIINGRGLHWWLLFQHKDLLHTRPHVIEMVNSKNIEISNIHIYNSAFWTIHIYSSSYVNIVNSTIHNPTSVYLPPHDSFYTKAFKTYDHSNFIPRKESLYNQMQYTLSTLTSMISENQLKKRRDERLAPNTDGIVPDSSSYIYINNVNIHSGDDCIAIKSGWDDLGLKYNISSSFIFINNMKCYAPFRSAVAIGSETSGGIHHIYADNIHVYDAVRALGIKLAVGRGGHIHDLYYSNINTYTVQYMFVIYSKHNQRKEGYNGTVLPLLDTISINNTSGFVSVMPGLLEGFEDSSWSANHISISNINTISEDPWNCSYIKIHDYHNVNSTSLGNCI